MLHRFLLLLFCYWSGSILGVCGKPRKRRHHDVFHVLMSAKKGRRGIGMMKKGGGKRQERAIGMMKKGGGKRKEREIGRIKKGGGKNNVKKRKHRTSGKSKAVEWAWRQTPATISLCDGLGECLVDTPRFFELEGDSSTTISFKFAADNTPEILCEQVTTQGNSWHGVCSTGGDVNLLNTRRKNDKGEYLFYGSLVDADKGVICQFSPNFRAENRVVCKPEASFPPEDDPIELPTDLKRIETNNGNDSRDRRNLNDCGPFDDSGSNIDLLVVWTIMAECKNSGLPIGCTPTAITEANMLGLIAMALEESNTAFEKSGVDTMLRLVHAYRHPTYVELTDHRGFKTALRALSRTSDGIMDDVHQKRAQYGADIVSMIIASKGSCGSGYTGPRKERMFSVTHWSCAIGKYSFVHEIAHNMGCLHDRGNASQRSCTSSGYSYGYRDPEFRFRSVMAYDCKEESYGTCDNISGGRCSRVQMFANAEHKYMGFPIGNSKNNNARRLNEMKSIVAGYYPCKAQSVSPPTLAPVPPPTQTPVLPPTAEPVQFPTQTPVLPPTAEPVLSPTSPPTIRSTDFPATTAPTTIAPSMATNSSPTDTNIVTALPCYLAMVDPAASRSPTDEEFSTIAERTADVFYKHLADHYSANDTNPVIELIGLDLVLNNTEYGAGKPDAKFNIYMDFTVSTLYTGVSEPESPEEQIDVLEGAIDADYILNIVRTLTGTPFETVNELFFGPLEDLSNSE